MVPPQSVMACRPLLLPFLAITLAAGALNTENVFNLEYDSSPSEVSTKRMGKCKFRWMKLSKKALTRLLDFRIWNSKILIRSLSCSKEISAPRKVTPWLRRSWSRAGGRWTRCWAAPRSPTAPAATARPWSPPATRGRSSTSCRPCPCCSSVSSTSPGKSRSRKGTLTT